MDAKETVDLLWPVSFPLGTSPYAQERAAFMRDLGIDTIVEHVYEGSGFVSAAKDVFAHLCDDVRVIQYRLDVIEDLLALPTLIRSLEQILPLIASLTTQRRRHRNVKDAHPFQRIAWRLDILRKASDCIEALHTALLTVERQLGSLGFRSLLTYLSAIKDSTEYQAFMKEMPQLVHKIERVSSVTIGINLSGDLRPVEATILSVDTKPFKERPLLARLFGLAEDDAYEGNSVFHSILKGRTALSATEHIMFSDLEEILHDAIKPIETALSRYTRDHSQFLIQLEPAIQFYLGAVQLIQQLTSAGVPMCKPEVAPKKERVCHIHGLFDINLALQLLQQDTQLTERIVLNNVDFASEGRIFILTGPNQGGKTTYTRAIGTAQVLFQAGLYVPGTSARMSPVDWIHTHFLEDEVPNSEEGKLAEECRRLATIFERASPYSLILLNESLSSTSPGESLYLTEGIVRGLRIAGCRAVFATHLHDLAARTEAINNEVPGDSKVVSMVAGLELETIDHDGVTFRQRSFRVMPGPPQGTSYALDIARRYGISLEQIIRQLQKRDVSEVEVG